MLKKGKKFKVTTEKTAQNPIVRILIAIAVIYALIQTINLHPGLGIVYTVLMVVVFFHFRRRRKLEAAGVEFPSPYASKTAGSSDAEADSDAGTDAELDIDTGSDTDSGTKTSRLPKRLTKPQQ